MLDLDLGTEVNAPPRDPSSDVLEMQLLDSKACRVPIGLDTCRAPSCGFSCFEAVLGVDFGFSIDYFTFRGGVLK